MKFARLWLLCFIALAPCVCGADGKRGVVKGEDYEITISPAVVERLNTMLEEPWSSAVKEVAEQSCLSLDGEWKRKEKIYVEEKGKVLAAKDKSEKATDGVELYKEMGLEATDKLEDLQYIASQAFEEAKWVKDIVMECREFRGTLGCNSNRIVDLCEPVRAKFGKGRDFGFAEHTLNEFAELAEQVCKPMTKQMRSINARPKTVNKDVADMLQPDEWAHLKRTEEFCSRWKTPKANKILHYAQLLWLMMNGIQKFEKHAKMAPKSEKFETFVRTFNTDFKPLEIQLEDSDEAPILKVNPIPSLATEKEMADKICGGANGGLCVRKVGTDKEYVKYEIVKPQFYPLGYDFGTVKDLPTACAFLLSSVGIYQPLLSSDLQMPLPKPDSGGMIQRLFSSLQHLHWWTGKKSESNPEGKSRRSNSADKKGLTRKRRSGSGEPKRRSGSRSPSGAVITA